MRVSILDLHCLNAIADDHETVASILDDVRRSNHGNIDANDTAACLVELARDGMAEACRFDSLTAQFTPLVSMPPELDDLWFRITDRGRRELDANWVEE